jgi:hypothetical protein
MSEAAGLKEALEPLQAAAQVLSGYFTRHCHDFPCFQSYYQLNASAYSTYIWTQALIFGKTSP